METTEQLAIDADTREELSTRSINNGGKGAFSFSFLGGNRQRNNIKTNGSYSPEKTESSSTRDTMSRQNPSTRRNNNNNEVVAGGYTNDRYLHDVEQARLMRQGMEKRKHQQQSTKELTESDVDLAFEGLDQVESLRRQGKLQEALKISELSLELLIQLLRADKSTLPNIDREMISEHIQMALTSAEQMKETLRSRSSPEHKRQQQQLQQNRTDMMSNRGTESTSKSLSKSLTEALGPNRSSSKSNKGLINRSSRQPAGQTTSSPIKKNTKSSTIPLNKQQPRKHTTTTSNSRHIHPSLASSADPLVQTIKSELYIDPSQMGSTTWQDIAGLEEAKQAIQEAAILPLMRPDLFSGLRKPRNILLYGPPGTGKTLLVKACAHESQSMLFICTASAMTSKWLGEGEKLIRALFRVAREAAPSIIFIDEMDALLSARKSEGEHEASRRFKTEVMTQMDGIVKGGGDNDNGKHLLVIAATNCPWDIDSAVLRRFPRRIYVPLPDSVTRKALLLNLLKKSGEYDMNKKDISAIVKRLDGFSGSDISAIASEASFGPLRSLGGIDAIRGAKSTDIRPIQRQDFEVAIDQATKSVSKKLLKKYDQWKEEQAAS